MPERLPENPADDNYAHPWEALAGWFLGPCAENRHIFNELTLKALNWHEDRRELFFPSVPSYFTDEFKNSEAAKHEHKNMEDQMHAMHQELNKSVPFFSTRYQGKMAWDVTMPSFLGYISGLLWNQNNVDPTSSPVTTKFEVEVGQQLCKLMRFDDAKVIPWGHLTGCGSVANIESMWAARNAKLHPLALKDACADPEYEMLKDGLKCKVFVPGQQKEKELEKCSDWELLNLRMDDICTLTDDVVQHVLKLNPAAEKVKKMLDKALEGHSLVQIGLPEFYKRHNIGEPSEADLKVKTYPRVFSPGTNHYSWPKASTILGIGDVNNIHIQVDSKARQDIATLEKELDFALKHKIPVIMVVAVIGSTKESAVDDISRILELKSIYEEKGLTFSIHADAAWGGYLNCMTHKTKETNVCMNRLDTSAHDFVPTIPLSEFVERQYISLQYADTVTIDPHKTGFCPYPAGALLYRNGTMKGFITLAAPEVFHSPNDLNVGVYGLEGSKPGAAACGVLLSHRVIGLDQNGYGRILGQCQIIAKLFYCMWETIARDDDPFICCNFIPVDVKELQDKGFSFQSKNDVHDFIKKHIIRKENRELVKNIHREMDFLGIVGPDALINSFTLNCKDPKTGTGQQNIELVNDFIELIFNELASNVGDDTKRVKLFLTNSKMEYASYGASVQQLKERLNLPTENHEGLGCLQNTCMEPFQATEAYVQILSAMFRNTVLTCIGALDIKHGAEYGDPLDLHAFTVVNNMRNNGKIFVDYVPTFTKKQSQYQAVLRVIIDPEDRQTFKKLQREATEPLFMRTIEQTKLFNFVKKNPQEIRTMALYQGLNMSNTCIANINIRIDEVWAMEHFELAQYAEYPKCQRYFMYGDEEEAFLSHIVTKQPDFYQIVRLGELPNSVEPQLLNLGLFVELPTIPGTPLVIDGKIADPLQTNQYRANYRGRQFAECMTSLSVGGAKSKVHFDSEYLNYHSFQEQR